MSARSAARLSAGSRPAMTRNWLTVVAAVAGRDDLDANGIGQEVVGEALDLRRHGRREEQRLAGEGQEFDDALDVGDEAHVEHAVGLVDDEDLDAVEEELAALEMIEHAAGRGDQHVGAAVELLLLVVEGDAADEERHRQLVVDAVAVEALLDLRGELARRLEDEGARHARARAALLEDGEHRQDEACGLAGAGLGDAEHVAALEHVRYRAAPGSASARHSPLASTAARTFGLSPRSWKLIFIVQPGREGRSWNVFLFCY